MDTRVDAGAGSRLRVIAALTGIVIVVVAAIAYVAFRANDGDSTPVASTPPEEHATPSTRDAETAELSVTLVHTAMATEFAITVYARPGDTDTAEVERIAQLAFEAVDDIESRISEWIPDSQISRVNNHAAEEPVPVAADVIALLDECRRLFKETDGAFDPTVGPLSRLYGFYDGQGRLPSDAEIQDALDVVGFEMVEFDRKKQTVRFAKQGVKLDFGGIGKGFAVDRAAQILRQHGVKAALLHGGTSSVVAIGAPPGRKGWTVDIRHPYNPEDVVDGVEIRDASVSTSGCYGDLPVVDGRKICNIFDPRTGHSLEGATMPFLSVSVIAPTATETDGLDTAFMVMGKRAVSEYCARHEGISAVVVHPAADGSMEPVVEKID